ncbi:histidine biosynthesis trifunctional protein [Plectosphaerella cucumerina]|uniref:Histidine biosynthesis trifunctional protein n=1 Tax=Plectosphaerella cucumerina TaxID=40658 RepID=A0A8K0TSB4_9PEZI|nr:histidine biosynthesis trifunctional protein [Plectosphaerella cucumerina]
METTLPFPFLISVSAPPAPEGLSKEQVAILGVPFFEAADASVERFLKLLKQHSTEFRGYFDVSAVSSVDDVVSLLDAGALKVFVTPEQLPEYADFKERVGAIVSASDVSSAQSSALLIKDFDPASANTEQLAKDVEAVKSTTVFVKPTASTDLESFIDVSKKIRAHPVLAADKLTVSKDDSTRLYLPKVISSFWKSDRADGLVPTMVCDESGVALGLAYSGEESVAEALRTRGGVYQSRKRGLWHKGATSGDTQDLLRISLDCDNDTLRFIVRQKGRFCHLAQDGCLGDLTGIARLEKTLQDRRRSAPEGSYTARLFNDEKLLRAKIMEEAEELCDAKTKEEVAFEAADLIYFALTKAVSAGVTVADIEKSLDAKGWKVKRRKGDAKGKWAEKEGIKTDAAPEKPAAAAPAPAPEAAPKSDKIVMRRYDASKVSIEEVNEALKRPSQRSPEAILNIVKPIIDSVRTGGDKAVLSFTHKFEKATSLTSPVLRAPFPEEAMRLSPESIAAIDISFENIRKFHAAQKEDKPLQVETMPGVTCSRFARPIERVGLYVPGGTAVLPSTALMLGVPAMVAGCQKIVFASPPRADGSLTPEVVYCAHKVGADCIVLAGGAQAVAAMAYGTESVPKVDKILGPGNQFVTAAKMYVSNDTNAGVGIDMPAGPSEVLVVADRYANPAFVASDLLSQAEHGVDSQVVLIAVGLDEEHLRAIEDELHNQALALPRVDIVRGAIAHSITVQVADLDEAMRVSNDYAPEHLILQVRDAEKLVDKVMNAGSVFIGEWTPESVGDYSAGVNHSLPTYGYAKQYSGVNLASFVKHITSSNLTAEGLRNVGSAVMQLAKVEELEAHRRAVEIRLKHMDAK